MLFPCLRILPILFALALLAACQNEPKPPSTVTPPNPPPAVAIEPDTTIGFKGTDRAQFRAINSQTSEFLYPAYTIRVAANAEDVGEKVAVTTKGANHASEIRMPEAGYFSGVSGHFLFLDAGTGPGARGLTIVDLRTRKPVLETEYYELDQVNSAGEVTFWIPIETKDVTTLPVCPDKAEWLRNGLSVGYGQRCTYDLNTGKLVTTQEYKCVPLQ